MTTVLVNDETQILTSHYNLYAIFSNEVVTMKDDSSDKLVVKHNKLIEFKGRMSVN